MHLAMPAPPEGRGTWRPNRGRATPTGFPGSRPDARAARSTRSEQRSAADTRTPAEGSKVGIQTASEAVG